MSPENLLSVVISWSSALLWIMWPSANILRLLLEKMSRRQQHFFIHSSYSHGNISLCVIPKSGCKWEQNETQVVTKSIACLLFDLFFRWNFIFFKTINTVVVVSWKHFHLPFHRYVEEFSCGYCQRYLLESAEYMPLDTGGPCRLWIAQEFVGITLFQPSPFGLWLTNTLC